MSFITRFPHALAVCFVLALLATTAGAQTISMRPRSVAGETQATTTTDLYGDARLENDLVVVSPAEDAEEESEAVSSATLQRGPLRLGQTESLMLAAIEDRLGIPYRMGSEGPNRYDCSGFVWSVFQTAGITFERSSARTFWSQFEPVDGDERFKFGTLVFFNNLRHVGIVADANGFYHASSSKGIVYSSFGEYWTKRISGFRRVRLSPSQSLLASSGR
ncbi:MAG: C40 family peptidase [Acidobacteria bacterium]|nr:C40 family peptidase [Acidobacteriota bacterium]